MAKPLWGCCFFNKKGFKTTRSGHLTTHLTEQQTKVNAEISFADKAAKAKSLWQAKNAAKFNEIYNILTQMSVGVRICNYCEANEADDIEHIYPKSFFPERAFSWENYLLACKSCNTQWKSDKCYIIEDGGNARKLARGEEPPVGSEITFINPRVENPNDFLYYDTRTHFFVPIYWLNYEEKEKAEKTLSILKNNFKQSVKNYIQSSRHLSVWHAIKTYDKSTPKWKLIFEQIPAALNW